MVLSTLFYLTLPYQLIFCTRKIKRVKKKKNNHKQISFRSLKSFTKENFEQELKNIASPNYEKLSDVNSIYSDLVNKIIQVINKHALYKTIRVKNQSNKWFVKLLIVQKKQTSHQ